MPLGWSSCREYFKHDDDRPPRMPSCGVNLWRELKWCCGGEETCSNLRALGEIRLAAIAGCLGELGLTASGTAKIRSSCSARKAQARRPLCWAVDRPWLAPAKGASNQLDVADSDRQLFVSSHGPCFPRQTSARLRSSTMEALGLASRGKTSSAALGCAGCPGS